VSTGPARGPSLVQLHGAVVCDLDGVVYRGPVAVPGAVEALTAVQVPVVYATNNASRSPEEVAEHLRRLGLPASGADVVTSAQAGARHLSAALPPASTVLAVGGPGVLQALQASGLAPVTPDEAREAHGAGARIRYAAVLQGYGPAVTAADLAEAAYAVRSGAVWVATNGDPTVPTERGEAPGNGALIAVVEAAVGSSPVVVGKPAAAVYLLCADRLGVAPARVLGVGDRLDTDIAGAIAAGMPSALVLTGITTVADVAAAPSGLRPTYVLQDLGELHLPYREPRLEGSWWVSGAERRRIRDGRWDVASRGSLGDRVRAGVAALHAAADGGALEQQEWGHLVCQLGRGQ
jgi:glycerol 3-phosphatase-2